MKLTKKTQAIADLYRDSDAAIEAATYNAEFATEDEGRDEWIEEVVQTTDALWMALNAWNAPPCHIED